MKRFTKLIFAIASLFSLTSCMNLLPTVSRKPRSSSMDEDSAFIDEKSSNERSSNSNASGEYFVGCDSIPQGLSGETVSTTFRLINSSNGQSMPLSAGCYASSFDSSLRMSYHIDYDLFVVELMSSNDGDHEFKVVLKSTSGEAATDYFTYSTSGGDINPDNYIVDYSNDIEVPYSANAAIYFRITNKYSGVVKRFDSSRPYDIDSSDAPSVRVDSFELVDDNTTLFIHVKGLSYTSVDGEHLYVKVIDEDGNTYNTDIHYIVKPMAHIQLDVTNDIFIEYGETVTFTASLFSSVDGSKMRFSKEGYELFANSGYSIELDYIDNTKIIFRVTNSGWSNEGWFGLRLVSEEGFTYESWFVGTTENYYNNNFWLQLNGESVSYQKDSYFTFILFNRRGENKLIKDLIIESTYGIIPRATIRDINAISYEYHFVPTKKGRETWSAKAVCYDGTEWTCGFETTIN